MDNTYQRNACQSHRLARRNRSVQPPRLKRQTIQSALRGQKLSTRVPRNSTYLTPISLKWRRTRSMNSSLPVTQRRTVSCRNNASPASRRAREYRAKTGGCFGRQLLAPRSGLYQLLHLRQSWNCVSVPPFVTSDDLRR